MQGYSASGSTGHAGGRPPSDFPGVGIQCRGLMACADRRAHPTATDWGLSATQHKGPCRESRTEASSARQCSSSQEGTMDGAAQVLHQALACPDSPYDSHLDIRFPATHPNPLSPWLLTCTMYSPSQSCAILHFYHPFIIPFIIPLAPDLPLALHLRGPWLPPGCAGKVSKECRSLPAFPLPNPSALSSITGRAQPHPAPRTGDGSWAAVGGHR